MNAVDLASLLCSRLCHDLLSPVGALNNGIELLADEQDPEMRERCLELLAESARASANKLKFFRLAFGAAGGFGDAIDTREARAALEGLFGADGGSSSAGWSPMTNCRRARSNCCSTSRCWPATHWSAAAGSMSAPRERTAASSWSSAPKARASCSTPTFARPLLRGSSGGTVEPRAAGAWLAHSLAAEAGGSIQLSDPADEVLVIGVTLPQPRLTRH